MSMASRRKARGARSESAAGDQELWIGFARDAAALLAPHLDAVATDPSKLVNDMVLLTTSYADEMLDEYLERFTKRRWDWAEPREDEEEDDEDEDDDED